ncbi:hypothetical protein ACFQ9V_08540 [Leifsonia sp. NPDC056665]|uniref:hypothetical protein n=1 Tax=Leifsonia sp. NPDC056665 TaxID=3345901 RepID=UPI0036CEEEDC
MAKRPPEYDQRATITDAEGKSRPVLASDLHGLDEFIAAWENEVATPHRMAFEAWQLADDFHPGGEGKSSYRIVWKTIRELTFPAVQITFPNLVVRFVNERVNRGEPVFTNALPDQEPGVFIVPEWGEILERDGQTGYQPHPNMQVSVQAHQEDLPTANIVEVIYVFPFKTEKQSYSDAIASGRASIAPLRMMLEFTFGDRLLGPKLTEEVGEVFDDWHWNRQLGGRDIRLESQADMRYRPAVEAVEGLQRIFTAHVERDEAETLRVRIASRWCWEAESQADPVMRFVSYWLAIEALELGENSNIAPLKDVVAAVLGLQRPDVTVAIGRLYATRNRLLHGKQRTIEPTDIDAARTIAHVLLANRALGEVTDGQLTALLKVVTAQAPLK